MKYLKLKIEGVSEIQIQKDIEKNTKGWRLFFEEPTGVSYQFMQPFWGYQWNQTSENLKDIIIKATKVGDKNKQHICVFKYNGIDRFAWCSWTKEVYDFNTKIKYQLKGNKLAKQITELIVTLI